jgi:predicted NBD/HSP70 family sugar kinase
MNLCAVRGCDDVPRARPAWYGLDTTSETCPVLAFTPDVEEWLDRFDETHEARQGAIVRIGLPGPGSAGEQDAKTIEALRVIRHATTRALSELARRPVVHV